MNSCRMQAVQSPMIPIVGALIRQHPGTISLGQGVVNYPPPQAALDRITDFLSRQLAIHSRVSSNGAN